MGGGGKAEMGRYGVGGLTWLLKFHTPSNA